MAEGLRSRKKKFSDEAAGGDELAGSNAAAGSDKEAGGNEEPGGNAAAGSGKEADANTAAGGNEEAGGIVAAGGNEEAGGIVAAGGNEAAGGNVTAGGNAAAGSVTQIIRRNWAALDDVPLERLFSFLNRSERYRLALVCRRWSRGLHFPCVWELFDFKLNSRIPKFTIDGTNYAEKYGHLFQKLRVFCEEIVDPRLSRNRIRRFKIFMQILTPKSQLTEIYFRNLNLCLNSVPKGSYDSCCASIANFLGCQERLQTLSFCECLLKYSSCIQILRGAIKSEGLVNLRLQGFLDYSAIHPDDPANEQILPEILELPKLKDLQIDYRLVLGENSNLSQVVELLENHRQNLNVVLHLIQTLESRNFNRLSSDQWRNLKAKNPNLQVEMSIFSRTDAQDITELFLVSDIPLTSLRYVFNSRESNAPVGQLLQLLVHCNTTEILKDLDFDICEVSIDLDSTFTRFLRTCGKLKYLVFRLRCTVKGVVQFLDSMRNRKPESLTEIKFVFIKPCQEAKRYLRNLSSEHRRCLASVQIALKMEFK